MTDLPSKGLQSARVAVTRLPAGLWILLTCLVVFAPTLSYELVWDDVGLLDRIDEIVRNEGWLGLLTAEFRLDTHYGYYRPTVMFSLALDRAVGGGSATLYHLVNIILHGLNSVLVWAVARQLLPRTEGAGLAALLFALHPAHVESVAFVSGRTDLWATLFVLVATILWLNSRGNRPSPLSLLVGGCSLLLALLAKEVALMLPLLLVLISIMDLPPRSEVSWRIQQQGWLVAWACALSIWFLLRSSGGGVGLGLARSADAIDQIAPIREDLSLWPSIWMAYARLLVWPWPLSAFYMLEDLHWFVPALCSGALITLCVVTLPRRHGRLGWVGGAWIVILLLPVSGVVPLRGAIVAERFLYLPSVGYCLILGYALARLQRICSTRRPHFQLASQAVILGGLSLMLLATLLRMPVWHNEIRLFTSIVHSSPTCVLAFNNLGAAHGRLGQLHDAVSWFKQAVAQKPDYVEAWTNLGFAFHQMGRHADARTAYETALHHDPGSTRPRLDLVMLLHEMGDHHGAQEQLNALRRIDSRAAHSLDTWLLQNPP